MSNGLATARTVEVSIGGTVHIAAPYVRIGNLLRQRCAWCGAIMLDYDLENTLSPCDERCQAGGCKPENHMPATWPAGELVEMTGGASMLVPHGAGDPLPTNACATTGATIELPGG